MVVSGVRRTLCSTHKCNMKPDGSASCVCSEEGSPRAAASPTDGGVQDESDPAVAAQPETDAWKLLKAGEVMLSEIALCSSACSGRFCLNR